MPSVKSIFALPRSDAAHFSASAFQTDVFIWLTVEMGLFFIIGVSAWFDIKLAGYEKVAVSCTVLLILALILNTVPSLIARRIGLLIEGAIVLVLGSTMGAYLAYELQMMALPLQDSVFDSWDKFLGFDYQNTLVFFNQHDILVKILHRAYYSFRWQIMGTIWFWRFSATRKNSARSWVRCFLR